MGLLLDDAVQTAVSYLDELLPTRPEALFLLGTGLGTLPGGLSSPHRVDLAAVPGLPRPWREGELVAGNLGPLAVWMLDDAPGDWEFGEGGRPLDPPWARAFPVWLAAAAGARVCLLTAAGGGLDPRLEPPALTLLTDHLNLSGGTPLEGLGETCLGPLFPDQSAVLDRSLRARALERAAQAGIELHEVVAAGVCGPALSTPAERRWYRRAGADVFAQQLSSPLIACAHAGLCTLGLLAVTDRDDEALRMDQLVARAEAVAPALEDLIGALAGELAGFARALEGEDLA